jgi:hypothetical protein
MKRKLLWLVALSATLLTTAALIVGGRSSVRAKPESVPVTAQESRMTSIPFKGVFNNDGRAELIVRVYDQANDGTKLFETTQAVNVSNGMYVAFIQVPSEAIRPHSTVWLEASDATAPDLRLEDRVSFTIASPRNGTTQAFTCDFPNGCASLCRTCGGAYPHFRGAIPLAAGARPAERGNNCSGPIDDSAVDTNPFLCTQ